MSSSLSVNIGFGIPLPKHIDPIDNNLSNDYITFELCGVERSNVYVLVVRGSILESTYRPTRFLPKSCQYTEETWRKTIVDFLSEKHIYLDENKIGWYLFGSYF